MLRVVQVTVKRILTLQRTVFLKLTKLDMVVLVQGWRSSSLKHLQVGVHLLHPAVAVADE